MKKVITYGTYDKLHFGHIRLLERAKALGDYLIVGVTSDDFDKSRGKINVQQPLVERIAAIKGTGLADEIIVEEYEGQKIDDIIKYGVDIFTVGSDWIGKFDYLNEYCEVVYLERTKGISSSKLRSEGHKIKLGLVGDNFAVLNKYVRESEFVNGIEIIGISVPDGVELTEELKRYKRFNYKDLLECVDAVYISSNPYFHDEKVKEALEFGKHVLCETPISINQNSGIQLIKLAEQKNLVLMEGIKTAYSLAFRRLLLLLKTGIIGDVISIDASCTSLQVPQSFTDSGVKPWGSMHAWGSFVLLPVLSVLGCNYRKKSIQTKLSVDSYDLFTKINFVYDHAVASLKVGNGVKTEGDMIISGTKGYIYVPAPWWKTDYFEVRFENPQDNKRYFYQLEGEGIRNMLVSFVREISGIKNINLVSKEMSLTISKVMEDFEHRTDTSIL